MLVCPQGDLFTAHYCTEPVAYFPSSPIMLAYPQGNLFTAQYYTKLVTYFPSSPIMLALTQWDLFTVKYGRDVHSYIVGTENERKQKGKKKTGRPPKKDPAFRRKWRAGNIHANKNSFWVACWWAYCPIQFWRGVGILYCLQLIGMLTS